MAGGPAAASDVYDSAARADVVLLGERHDVVAHRRWHAEALAALKARRRALVIGVEMLPRSADPILARYVAGAIDEATFLAETRWAEVWGFDFALYRPLFSWARANAVAMVGLNIDRDVIRRIGREGYDARALAEVLPVQKPRPPAPAYAAWLAEVFGSHGKAADPTRIARFTDAQQAWDRAMAESLAAAHAAHPGALVVGVMGYGHIDHGWGVPWQIAPLGGPVVFTLRPWGPDADCAPLAPDVADAVRRFG